MPTRVIESLSALKALVGQEVSVSDWITVTQERINQFAEATGDHQWIHIDADRAKVESPFHSTIAHGFLTLSLLSELSREAIDLQGEFKMRINYGLNRLRFPAPVLAGSRLRVRFTLQSVEENDNFAQITWSCLGEIENQAKPTLAAEWLIRVYF